MADPIEIYDICGRCHGDGQYPNAYINFQGEITQPESTIDCTSCNGAGRIATHFLDGSIRDLFSDIMDKCDDILDKID